MNSCIMTLGGLVKANHHGHNIKCQVLKLSDKCYDAKFEEPHLNTNINRNTIKNSGSQFMTLPQPMAYHSIILYSRWIYVIGGACNYSQNNRGVWLKPSNLVYKYNIKLKIWIKAAPMLRARILASVVNYEQYIYVIGGKDENQRFIDLIERYDCTEDKWEAFSQYSDNGLKGVGIVGCSCVEMDGKIYIVGGCVEFLQEVKCSDIKNGDSPMTSLQNVGQHVSITDSFQYFDPKTLRFKQLNPLKKPRAHGSMVVVKNKMYLIGGLIFAKQSDPVLNNEWEIKGVMTKHSYNPSPTPDIDVWDQIDNIWYCLRKLQIPRHCFETICIGNNIYVLGGYQYLETSEDLKLMEIYDVEKNTLITRLTNLPPYYGGYKVINIEVK